MQWLFHSIQGLFSCRRYKFIAYSFYGSLVEQARNPKFYIHYGVPDTVEGRFRLIVVHMIMFQHHFVNHPKITQAILAYFIKDITCNLRELGISDIRIGPKVKEKIFHFYGVLLAYKRVQAREEDLKSFLCRNIFRDTDVTHVVLDQMFAYIQRCEIELRLPFINIMDTLKFTWPKP